MWRCFCTDPVSCLGSTVPRGVFSQPHSGWGLYSSDIGLSRQMRSSETSQKQKHLIRLWVNNINILLLGPRYFSWVVINKYVLVGSLALSRNPKHRFKIMSQMAPLGEYFLVVFLWVFMMFVLSCRSLPEHGSRYLKRRPSSKHQHHDRKSCLSDYILCIFWLSFNFATLQVAHPMS